MQLTLELSQEDSTRLSDIACSQDMTESDLAATFIHDSLDRLMDEPSEKTKRFGEYIMDKHRELMLRLAK